MAGTYVSCGPCGVDFTKDGKGGWAIGLREGGWESGFRRLCAPVPAS